MKDILYESAAFLLKVLFLFLLIWFCLESYIVVMLIMAYPFVSVPVILMVIVGIAEIYPGMRKGRNFFIRHILQPILLIVAGSLILMGFYLAHEAEEMRREAEYKQKIQAVQEFVKQGDEILCYNDATYYDDIMGTGLDRNSVIIDYDTMCVGFLHGSSLYDFDLIQLSESGPCEGVLQTTAQLESPASVFTSYAPYDEELSHKTTAVQIVMEDGRVFSAHGLKEDSGQDMYLGLSGAELGEEQRSWEEICGR